jgi:glycosyltransferase involved in cell wall biosynthesis
LLRHADAVVALSEIEAAILRDRYGVTETRLSVIPNGLELERYAGGAVAAGPAVNILAVGQMIPLKGHLRLIEAFADVRRRHPNVVLTIVGHNQELRPRYEERARELGIAEGLVFAAHASDALALTYRAADIFVQPSLVECFPITVAEAMASGLAVVATDVGGVRAELGDAGIIVPAGDTDALAKAIELLVVDREARNRLGSAASARARCLFAAPDVARRHLQLYERIASRARPSAARAVLAAGFAEAYRRRSLLTRPLRRLSRAG